MEPTLSTTQIPEQTKTQSEEVTVPSSKTAEPDIIIYKKNFYPKARHLLLIAFLLMVIFLVLFLVHQNGKSLYENGI